MPMPPIGFPEAAGFAGGEGEVFFVALFFGAVGQDHVFFNFRGIAVHDGFQLAHLAAQ